jgi:hypothetical protein
MPMRAGDGLLFELQPIDTISVKLSAG